MDQLHPILVYAGMAVIILLQTFISNNQKTIMTQNEQVLAYAARIDAGTNEVANDLKNLRAQLAEQGVTGEALAALDAAAVKLEATGKDPETTPETTPEA